MAIIKLPRTTELLYFCLLGMFRYWPINKLCNKNVVRRWHTSFESLLNEWGLRQDYVSYSNREILDAVLPSRCVSTCRGNSSQSQHGQLTSTQYTFISNTKMRGNHVYKGIPFVLFANNRNKYLPFNDLYGTVAIRIKLSQSHRLLLP